MGTDPAGEFKFMLSTAPIFAPSSIQPQITAKSAPLPGRLAITILYIMLWESFLELRIATWKQSNGLSATCFRDGIEIPPGAGTTLPWS